MAVTLSGACLNPPLSASAVVLSSSLTLSSNTTGGGRGLSKDPKCLPVVLQNTHVAEVLTTTERARNTIDPTGAATNVPATKISKKCLIRLEGSLGHTENTPVVGIQPVHQDEELRAIIGVSVVDGAKDPDTQDTAKAADNSVEPVDKVQAGEQPEQESRDTCGREYVTDEEDTQDTWRFERDDNCGNDDYDRDNTDVDQRQFVAEHVV
jgi:hypothetical protein